MKESTLPYQEGRSGNYVNRAQEMRRDNDIIKIPKVTLYDIDYAVYFHLAENLKPTITQNDVQVPVPVMFANGEKWAQIRKYGFLRDSNKKVFAPVMVLRRTNVTNDERLPIVNLNVFGPQTFSPKNKIIPYKTTNMVYDRIAGQHVSKDSYEFYLTDVPDYVRVNYELIIWTDLQEQMNVLVQGIIPLSDHVWGDYWKFRTNVQDISHDNVNIPGEDRLVKSTITLQVDGYLRNEYEYHQSKIMKAYSLKRVHFFEEDNEKIIFDQVQDLIAPNLPPKPIQDVNLSEDGRTLKRQIRNNL